MDKANRVMAEIVDRMDPMCLFFLPAQKFSFGDFRPRSLPFMKNGNLRQTRMLSMQKE